MRKQKPITKNIQSWKNRKEKFILLSGGSMWQRMGYPDSMNSIGSGFGTRRTFATWHYDYQSIMGGSFNAMQ